MKKFLLILMLFVAAPVVAVHAQELEPVKDWISGLLQPYFVSLAVFSAAIVLVAGWINRLLDARKFAAQLVSWLVAICGGFIASFLGLGIFADLPVWWTIIVSLAGGLVANGLYDIAIVQQFLQFLKAIVPEK